MHLEFAAPCDTPITDRDILEPEALAQPPQLGPDLIATEFALELVDRLSGRIGAQASQTRCVAGTCVVRLDRRSLGLLVRGSLRLSHRRLRLAASDSCRRTRFDCRRPRTGSDAFVQTLHLRPQPHAAELALEAG